MCFCSHCPFLAEWEPFQLALCPLRRSPWSLIAFLLPGSKERPTFNLSISGAELKAAVSPKTFILLWQLESETLLQDAGALLLLGCHCFQASEVHKTRKHGQFCVRENTRSFFQRKLQLMAFWLNSVYLFYYRESWFLRARTFTFPTI